MQFVGNRPSLDEWLALSQLYKRIIRCCIHKYLCINIQPTKFYQIIVFYMKNNFEKYQVNFA